jgi:tetratricopeptide (TPR) repeat protein
MFDPDSPMRAAPRAIETGAGVRAIDGKNTLQITHSLFRRGAAALAALTLGCLATVAEARDNPLSSAALDIGVSPSGNYLSAWVAGVERDTNAASTYYREALRADPRNADLIERALIATLANGNVSDGLSLAERLILRDPNNNYANLALGVQAIQNKQWAFARAHFTRGSARAGRDVTTTLLTAWTYAGAGDERKALETVDRLNEGTLTVFRDYHAALIADLLGDTAEALKRIKAVYAADSSVWWLVDAYGRMMDRHGDPGAAKKAYEAFDKVVPRDPLVRAALDTLAAGKALAPTVDSADKGAAQVLYGLGTVGNREGDELTTMIYLRLSLFLDPRNTLAIVTLADLYDKVKQDETAISVYELIPDDSPLRSNADIQIGLTLDALGRTDEALKYVEKIVAARPKDVEAWSALGNLYSAAKKYPEAEHAFDKAIDALGTPEAANWALFYRRGITFERQNKWPLAEADFKRALELYPDQPLVLNYLGYSWVDKGMNLDEAFAMLKRAVDQRPDDGFIVDSLGWAYYKLGQYPQAVKDLERAVSLKPGDPVINDHLGDAYWRVGRRLEAKFQWNHARDSHPEPEDLANIMKKIDNGLPQGKAASDKPDEAKLPPKKTGG